MDARQLLEQGKLYQAIDTLSEALRSNPGDANQRLFLVELLCFAGYWERADKQLDVLGHRQPEFLPGVMLLRHLIRAGLARQQFFSKGRVPEFLAAPEDTITCYLRASVVLREGDIVEASRLLNQAEQSRKPLTGNCDGKPFDDFRDLDDATAGILEVLTNNGKYLWVALDQIESIEFQPPKRLRDLLWRQARLTVAGNLFEGNVFVPVTYPTAPEQDELASLGRNTDWRQQGDDTNAVVRGIGQRMFLVAEDVSNIMAIQSVEFTADKEKNG